jgi:hypothetical protein
MQSLDFFPPRKLAAADKLLVRNPPKSAQPLVSSPFSAEIRLNPTFVPETRSFSCLKAVDAHRVLIFDETSTSASSSPPQRPQHIFTPFVSKIITTIMKI